MKFGYFDDQNKEYVITTPQTPLPWINYLGSEDFFSLVSNTAGGYSFYRDARMRRLTRYRYNNSPLDMDGHRIYIKDGDTVWNPGWQPTKTPLDSYSCRHGLGYTILEGKKDGVTARQELFVPKGDACELDRVTVCNGGTTVKELDLFSYVEFCLWDAVDDSSNFQRNYSTGEVEVEGSVIYHKTEYRERRNHYAVFWANCPVDSFDTTRDAFCGVYGGPADPQAVRAGHCSGSIAHGWAPVGALHIHLTLAPGESRSILFGLGYIENPQQEKFIAPGVINKTRAHAMMERYATDAQIDAARAALRTHWEELLSTYHLESGEEKLNRMVNIWHQYQCMVTFNMSRSASYYESGTGRGMGFRDSCQDLLGFVHIIPSRARERILDIAATQFEDGSAYHQYQPLTKKGNRDIGTGFNDDPLWLIAGTAAYLRETGDWSILEEQVPFDNDATKAQPLMEHLRRSFNFTCTHLGPHGLHRGSFQSTAVIYAKDGSTYTVSHWSDDGKTIYLADGTTVGWNRGTITKADGSTVQMDHYEVLGTKYVPVRVATSDLADFCSKYTVVENGGQLVGGYSEKNLTAYTLTAAVDKNTNGLKYATRSGNGYTFSAAHTGTGSGVAEAAQKAADGLTVNLRSGSDVGSFGEFIRVDLNGNYGELGSRMQSVVWTYYGNDSTYTHAKASYGTKFAADNWMHKSMGIQLGLSDSARCQLPEGTDGTGYWTVTIRALGYADTVVKFQTTAENLAKHELASDADRAALQAVVAEAQSKAKAAYTADSYANLETELAESVELLSRKTLYKAAALEQVTHLTDAVQNLKAA